MYYYGHNKPTHTVDYILSNKLITKNSFVLLPDNSIGKVLKFQSGVITLTNEGVKTFKYNELKSILLFATNKNIYVNSVVIMNDDKEKIKKFSGIIKTNKLLKLGDSIFGIESGRIFQEGVSYYNDDIY
jgi:hypothetical protein